MRASLDARSNSTTVLKSTRHQTGKDSCRSPEIKRKGVVERKRRWWEAGVDLVGIEEMKKKTLASGRLSEGGGTRAKT